MCCKPEWSPDLLDEKRIREDENDKTITVILQELEGTWRYRDRKLFDIIEKHRRVRGGEKQ